MGDLGWRRGRRVGRDRRLGPALQRRRRRGEQHPRRRQRHQQQRHRRPGQRHQLRWWRWWWRLPRRHRRNRHGRRGSPLRRWWRWRWRVLVVRQRYHLVVLHRSGSVGHRDLPHPRHRTRRPASRPWPATPRQRSPGRPRRPTAARPSPGSRSIPFIQQAVAQTPRVFTSHDLAGDHRLINGTGYLVPGRGDQRDRHRRRLGRLWDGHPAGPDHRARRTDRRLGGGGRRPAKHVLDGPGVQRRPGHHRVPRDPLHRRRSPDAWVFASTATSQAITGLTNGTSYTFRVATTNTVGTGPDSASAQPSPPTSPVDHAPFATLERPDHPAVPGLPGPGPHGRGAGPVARRHHRRHHHRGRPHRVPPAHRPGDGGGPGGPALPGLLPAPAGPSRASPTGSASSRAAAPCRWPPTSSQPREFTQRYGSLTNLEFVELIYQNVLRPGGRGAHGPGVSGPSSWTTRSGAGS